MLPAWVSGEASNDGGMDPLAAASLHGWVNLTNISGSACTLDSVPTVGLPPHGTANFRIDWGAPYCPGQHGPFPGPPDQGPFGLIMVVDHVSLDIAVHSTVSPGCVSEEAHANVTSSSVVTSPIEPGAVIPGPPAAKPSPLKALRATAAGYPTVGA